MKRPKLGAGISLCCLVTIGGFTALPILAVGVGDGSASGCAHSGAVADDGTPSILGPSALTVADLRAWWESTGRGHPSRLRVAVGDLIAPYVTEGDVAGVPAALAFAQAVLATGYSTHTDTATKHHPGNAPKARPAPRPACPNHQHH